MKRICMILGILIVIVTGCKKESKEFPHVLVEFNAHKDNPVFAGTGADTWDSQIRERGFIRREGDIWHMWYTGYNTQKSDTKFLGYATSPFGFNWTRHDENPVFDESWVEDMFVVKHEDVYYMFAEGRNDIAHMLTSTDRVHWEEQGKLDIRTTLSKPLSPGPYGTPTVWIEGDTWYLFYERNDEGIWLATSKDRKVWTNVQDEPVIQMGPEPYDTYGVAMNQIIKYKGRYYGYYHATNDSAWSEWSMNVAVSTDLVHWKKYENNPILKENKSSGFLVHDGQQFRLYTMHPDVRVHFPKETRSRKQSLMEQGDGVKKLADGFAFTEGPVADSDGNLFFTDIPNNRIHKWSAEGQLSIFREKSGAANGLFFTQNGDMLVCEGGNRQLTAIDPYGKVSVLADKYNNKKLNSPNDLWIDPQGGVYFTDPRYGNRDNLEQDGEHVYYLSPDRKILLRVIDDMVRPNGIIGTPDGKRLYVTDLGDGKTFVYTIQADGTLSDKKFFAPEGSDGMTIDQEGNVYLTTSGVSIYNATGQFVEKIEVPERPANVCFGDKDRSTLYITARTGLYSVRMRVKGVY